MDKINETILGGGVPILPKEARNLLVNPGKKRNKKKKSVVSPEMLKRLQDHVDKHGWPSGTRMK